MVPTAVSQIFEQIVQCGDQSSGRKEPFDLGVKSNLVYGSTEYSYAFGAAGGALGTGAGALTALILFVGLYLMYRPKMKRRIRKEQGTSAEGYGMITSTLFLTVVPIIVSSSLYNSSTVIDNVLFGQIMTGLGRQSRSHPSGVFILVNIICYLIFRWQWPTPCPLP